MDVDAPRIASASIRLVDVHYAHASRAHVYVRGSGADDRARRFVETKHERERLTVRQRGSEGASETGEEEKRLIVDR